MKEFKTYKTRKGNKHFEIEEDLPGVGWYLRVYNDQYICEYDFLQNTLEDAMDFALEEFNIEKDKWKEIIN